LLNSLPGGDMSLLRVTGDRGQRRGAAGAATRDAGPAAGGGAAGVGQPEVERPPVVGRPGWGGRRQSDEGVGLRGAEALV